jgi:hypothetical protein
LNFLRGSDDASPSESCIIFCMAKIFGGTASRLEMYGLFVAAVVLVGGSVSGAIVLSSEGSPAVAPPSVESPVEAPPVGAAASATTTSSTSSVDGSQTPLPFEAGSDPSAAGRSEAGAPIANDFTNVETEAQRLARLEQERYDYAAANPVARFDRAQILSCTQLSVYDPNSPGTVVDTAVLVTYSITYEVFHQMAPYSYVNPGLPVYQTTESGVRQMVLSDSAFAPQVQLELNPGRHTMVLHGLRYLSNNLVRNVEVRMGSVDSTYGFTQFDLPSIGPICA